MFLQQSAPGQRDEKSLTMVMPQCCLLSVNLSRGNNPTGANTIHLFLSTAAVSLFCLLSLTHWSLRASFSLGRFHLQQNRFRFFFYRKELIFSTIREELLLVFFFLLTNLVWNYVYSGWTLFKTFLIRIT